MNPRAAAGALALVAALGCSDRVRPVPRVDLAPTRGAVVARVGDLAITDLDVAAVARERSLSARGALDALVRDALLAHEARRSGLVGPVELADDAWRARIQALLARDVEARFAEAMIPPQVLAQAMEVRRPALAHRGLRKVVHAVWVVSADAGAGPNEAALARMFAFREELARATQGRPTAAQFRAAAEALHGGASLRVEELEPFDREGRTPSGAAYVQVFAEAGWTLSAAEPLSEPFTSSFGVHVALLLEEVPPMTRTDDELRAMVAAEVVQRARVEGARTLLTGLRQRRRVQVSESALRQVERMARRGP